MRNTGSKAYRLQKLWRMGSLVVAHANTVLMKKFEILQELPKCDPETGSKQMLLEK